MSWSYSGNPSNSPLDETRFRACLTDINNQILQDEEIQFVIDEHAGLFTYKGLIEVLLAALACLSRKTDEKVGQISVSKSQLSEQYLKLIEKYEPYVIADGVDGYFGGNLVSDNKVLDGNNNLTRKQFSTREFDNPFAVQGNIFDGSERGDC